jgi:Tfp pilus assembly protein PilN
MRAVNLIPAEQRSGQPVGAGRSQGGAYAVLVLIGGFALMAYLYGSAHHKIATRRTEVATLTAEAQHATAVAEQLAPYTSFIAQRNSRTEAVETLIDSRFDWAHVFHEFGRVLPKGVTVSSLTGTVGSSTTVSAASASASGPATPPGAVPTFTLSGCATSQPTVALTLQRLRLIDGVKEVTLQSSTAGPKSTTKGTSESSSGNGGCATSDPVFSVQIIFDPLPTAEAVTAATKTVSDPEGKGSASSSSTSSGSSLR